jgi:hypothetical protein
MIVRIKAEDFARALKCIIPHASKDTARPHLNSILIATEGAHLVAVATNGHKLAHWRFASQAWEMPLSDAASSFLLKLDDAKAVAKAMPRKLSPTDWVSIDTKSGSFAFCNQAFQFTAVDAQFPPYQQVIPTAEALTTHPGERYVPWLAINPEYLAGIAKSFADASERKQSVMYIASSHAKPISSDREQQCLDPIAFRGDAYELTIICMPVRADIPSHLTFPLVPVADAAE